MRATSPYIEKLEELTREIPDIPIFMQHLFTQCHDMLVVSDEFGKFVWVNSFTEKLLGYTREELYKMPWEKLIFPEDKIRTIEEYGKILNDHSYNAHCFANRYLKKDGTIVPLCWNTTGVIDGYIYCIARHCELSRNII